MLDNLTTTQIVFVIVASLVWAAVVIGVFVAAWHVGWIARGPVAVGPDPTLEAARRWQAMAAGVRPWYLPQQRSEPEPEPETVGGKHRSPDPVPEEETPPVQVAGVPSPDDMSAVDVEFAQHFRDLRNPPSAPTQKVSTIGWPNNPPAPAVPFPVEIDRQDRALRDWNDDPDRTGLVPPVTSRRGAA